MSRVRKLVVLKDGVDVSDDIELRDSRANPFGWLSARLVHMEKIYGVLVEVPIGWLESGNPDITEEGYTASIEDM